MLGGGGIIFYGTVHAVAIVREKPSMVRPFAIQVRLSFNENLNTKRIISKLLMIGACMAVTSGSIKSLQGKEGLPLQNQITGWVVLSRFEYLFTWTEINNFPSRRVCISICVDYQASHAHLQNLDALLGPWHLLCHLIYQYWRVVLPCFFYDSSYLDRSRIYAAWALPRGRQ